MWRRWIKQFSPVYAPPVDGGGEPDFDSFFKEATGEAAEGSTEPTAEEKAETERLAAEEAEKAAADKAETERLAAEQAAKPVDVDAILAQARETAKAETERLAAEKAAAEKAEAERLAAEQATQPTPEEIAADEQFRKDWPQHAAALDKQKAELEALKKMMAETLAAVNGKVDPLIANTQEQIDREHTAAVTAKHPDAFELDPKEIQAWLSAQPAYLQPAYAHALNAGTADEVVQVLDAFKLATGKTADAQTAAAEKAAAEKAAAEKAEADRQKALHMAPVGSRRGATTGAVDASDFQTAFVEAAKEAAQKMKAA